MGRPFTTEQARAVGLSRRMLDGNRFELIHPGSGVWAVAGEEHDLAFMLRSDLLMLPDDSAVSHVTGLQLHGVQVGSNALRHWSTNRSVRRRSTTLVLHRRKAPLTPVLVDGIPVLRPHRCLVDAAIMLSHRDIVRAADALIEAGSMTIDAFADYVWRRHLHGVRRSRANLGNLRERVKSFRESDLRLLMAIAGLPEPVVNADIHDDRGNHLACGDLVLRPWRIVIEYDGWYHERSAQQRRYDIARRERLEANGWLVIIVVSGDIDRAPALIARIWRALVSRGFDGSPPRYLPWEWAELTRDPKA